MIAQAASGSLNADDFNFMNAVKRELGMESNKLDAELRERVERAIASLGYRVTVGDVAARAGVKLSEVETALKAIAYDSLGNLEVGATAAGWLLSAHDYPMMRHAYAHDTRRFQRTQTCPFLPAACQTPLLPLPLPWREQSPNLVLPCYRPFPAGI